MHRRWLSGLRFEQPVRHIVLEDFIETIEAATARCDRLTAQIKDMLSEPHRTYSRTATRRQAH
jgi:transposase